MSVREPHRDHRRRPSEASRFPPPQPVAIDKTSRTEFLRSLPTANPPPRFSRWPLGSPAAASDQRNESDLGRALGDASPVARNQIDPFSFTELQRPCSADGATFAWGRRPSESTEPTKGPEGDKRRKESSWQFAISFPGTTARATWAP